MWAIYLIAIQIAPGEHQGREFIESGKRSDGENTEFSRYLNLAPFTA